RDEKQEDSVPDALHHTLATSGKAIVLTTILVVSGLSVLVFSQFLPTVRFAELTAITMLTALPGDLLLLPAMLSFLGGEARKPSEDR
ncbi:MAG: MMPL family transporter, partial [Fuerstiella sp.]